MCYQLVHSSIAIPRILYFNWFINSVIKQCYALYVLMSSHILLIINLLYSVCDSSPDLSFITSESALDQKLKSNENMKIVDTA